MATLTVFADDTVITRKRKKYKFAKFFETPNCYEVDEWQPLSTQLPVVIELGAGTGYFSVELARRHPDRQYVAVDVKADRLQAGARLAIDRSITNIIFVRAHASQLPELFAPHTIDTIWLTFSDPFPKKRHAKHRMTHPDFLSIYQNLLVSTGLLSIKTDNHHLFDWSLEQLVREKWQLKTLTYDLHSSDWEDDYLFMTTYEKRFVTENLPIYALDASPFSF